MSTSPDPEGFVEPSWLVMLRRLVMVLTVVMILGIIVITVLMVLRYNNRGPSVPDTIVLPDGVRAEAFTQAADWYAVVTSDNRILIFNRDTGALQQTIVIESP